MAKRLERVMREEGLSREDARLVFDLEHRRLERDERKDWSDGEGPTR